VNRVVVSCSLGKAAVKEALRRHKWEVIPELKGKGKVVPVLN